VDCERVRDQFLVPEVTGEDGPWTEDVAQHLERCEPCRGEWEGLARTWALLGRWPDESPAEEIRGRLVRRIRLQLLKEALLSIPPVLAAVIAVALSLGLSLLIPYPFLVSLCRVALRASEAHVAPYLVAGMAYGVPLAAGVWVLRKRVLSGALVGSVEAALLFLVVLAPWVLIQCRDFAPLLQAAFLLGMGAGAVASSLVGLGLTRLAPT